MSFFNQLYVFDGFPDGGFVFLDRELQAGAHADSAQADGSAPPEDDLPPPNAVASTAMMVVLLLLIIALAIFFCCM